MKDVQLLKQEILPTPKVVGKILLNNLSYEEIFQKMDEDYLHWESTGYLEKKALTKRREIIKKKPKTEIFYSFSLRGKSGLQYVLMLKSENYNEFKKGNTGLYIYALYPFGDGRDSAILYFHDSSAHKKAIFTPHFFDRYQERALGNEEIATSEVMKLFFKEAETFTAIAHPTEKYPNCHYIVHEKGIALGSSNGNYLKMNTYLSEEQLKGDQIGIDAMCKSKFQQIQEQAHDILLKERVNRVVLYHGQGEIVKQGEIVV